MRYVYIVQTECGGIPDEPEAFASLKAAERRYIALVNDITESAAKTYDDAETIMHEKWESGGVRLFSAYVRGARRRRKTDGLNDAGRHYLGRTA